ncbi:tRNA (guanosine(37)-N1)-methyltransferase TrmD [candidate division Kazan bacterium]|uniref:tRNA (guanine-N(1)-)-methyltransferase n=1 Tax=candidate division Kazan bacterium TaxID=2202143 RepID=A0A420ZD39_UNCK3|nr:MAG: tRNA (guanosine(37)-N1)-methyltransferase TrmD [candidate division Kazan bacterium]
MKFTVITIFPQLIEDYFKEGILSRALKKKQVRLKTINPRKFTKDRHQTVDDLPYGGGAGLVLKPEPIVKAIRSIKKSARTKGAMADKQRIILLDPRGKRFVQKDARRLARYDELVFVSGRYEGIDERVKHYVDERISVGDFVLMGGELAALTIMETVARLLPGVLHHPESPKDESFSDGRTLEYPQYTRPEMFEGRRVPKVLLSGNHQKIKEWRQRHSKR